VKIPTNEQNLRKNLHEAVENLSLVNIIILLVLIRAVQVISWLRPGERDLKALPDPTAGPVLDETPPMPRASFGTLPENYPQIASITHGAGPEPGSGEITIQDRDGRDWTFQEWMAHQRRSVHREANRRAAEQERVEIWNGNPYAPNAFPGLLNEPLVYWEHTGVDTDIDQSSHRRYATVTPSGEPAYHAEILAWALTDCNERVVMFERPGGFYRIETAERLNLDAETPIEAPQYTQAELEHMCIGRNRHREYVQSIGLRAHRHSGYCTPSRDSMFTGLRWEHYNGPRNRENAREWERAMADMIAERGSLANGDVPGPTLHMTEDTPVIE
jgi:hypothetical protein